MHAYITHQISWPFSLACFWESIPPSGQCNMVLCNSSCKEENTLINALFVVPNSVYWQVHVMLKELFICHVLVHGVARSTHPTGALGHACTESLFSTTATCNLTWSLSRENQYAQIKINLHTCCLVERITLAEIIKTIIAGCSRLSFLHWQTYKVLVV